MDFNWVNNGGPFNKEAFGDGLLMICYARMPGFIAMVDVDGKVKWHWQVDDIGVRAATLTPQGTVLAMLRPPNKDVIDDQPKEHRKILEEIQKPMRRGKIGFAGGTAMAEIDLTGKTLWRSGTGIWEKRLSTGSGRDDWSITMRKPRIFVTTGQTKWAMSCSAIG